MTTKKTRLKHAPELKAEALKWGAAANLVRGATDQPYRTLLRHSMELNPVLSQTLKL